MAGARRPTADPVRLAAVRILHSVFEEGAFANLSSIRQLSQAGFKPIDRAFASALIYGTISRVFSIDFLLAKSSRKPLDSLDPWIRTILRMGVWQLAWSRSVPARSAIDESVKLAKVLTNPGSAGFVNAVLRSLSQESLELPANKPPVFYSLPPELYGYLKKWYGSEEAARIALSFLDDDVPVTVRVNRLRAHPDKLLAELSSDTVEASAGRYMPEALILHLGGTPVVQLAAWQRGDMMVQNEAAMLASHVASPKPDSLIIDLCAAPGGKTCHLAEMVGDQARILAFDSHAERLSLVEDNARRLGLGSIVCAVGDATGAGFDPALKGQADLVVADVPCSGLGLLGRKPEIRLNMTHERMIGLYPLQQAILDHAASLVKPGGTLLYSTCTINPRENIDQVKLLLERSSDFSMTDIRPHLPQALLDFEDIAASAQQGWVQLLPSRHGLDGFFIARLHRKDYT